MNLALDALQQHFQNEQDKIWGLAIPLQQTSEGIVGCFAHLQLRSFFQPLLNAATLQPEAHEALLRPVDKVSGEYLPPAAA